MADGVQVKKNIRKPKAIIRIEKWAGFPMRLFVDAEKRQIGVVSFGPNQGPVMEGHSLLRKTMGSERLRSSE